MIGVFPLCKLRNGNTALHLRHQPSLYIFIYLALVFRNITEVQRCVWIVQGSVSLLVVALVPHYDRLVSVVQIGTTGTLRFAYAINQVFA
jgi:hypothetical protein